MSHLAYRPGDQQQAGLHAPAQSHHQQTHSVYAPFGGSNVPVIPAAVPPLPPLQGGWAAAAHSAQLPHSGGQHSLQLYYRPLQDSDKEALKAIHRELFPIDYEDSFFQKSVQGLDRVFSWAAVHSSGGQEQLVGFVTARVVYFYECDPLDRQMLGCGSKALDGHSAVYVLTLGVVDACRNRGIARSLLGLVQQTATRKGCRAIFLHVISYNVAAMRLYGSAGYGCMARLPNFYHLTTGRQPNPDQSWYDAYLYASFLPGPGVGQAGWWGDQGHAMQWAGGVLGAAVAPFRSMVGNCMHIPAWLCRYE